MNKFDLTRKIAALVACVLIASSCTNDRATGPVRQFIPLLLQSNVLTYPQRSERALDGMERDVQLSGLPERNQLGVLLEVANGDRVDWTMQCGVNDVGRLQDCRITEIFPDTAAMRAAILPVLSRVSIELPEQRQGQQPIRFTAGLRVTTRVGRISRDEPCAALFFCPFSDTSQPGAAPPQPK